MAEANLELVKSLYDLPTYQRRLRHVRNLTLRNVQCKSYHGKDIAKLQVYFTLHMDDKLKEFYKSETICGSLNPSWQSFDIGRFEEQIDIQSKLFVVRVLISNKGDQPKLLMEWTIHLTGLTFFTDKLQQDKYKYVPNMLIVGMFDKYFIAPEVPLLPEQEQLQIYPMTNVRNSYTINSLARIHTVLRAIKQMQASVKRVHMSIEDKLLSSQEKTQKLSTREDLLLRVGQLRHELSWQMNKLQTQKDVSENCRKAKDEKSHDLKVKFHQLEKNRLNSEEKRKAYFQTRETYIKENAQLLIRRKRLISELTTYIYPITEKPKAMCICGVPLPNSENFQGKEEIMYAVSLGYTCQLMLMMSQILDFPLRYNMEFKGSRSLITDHVHAKLTQKDKTFPLYSKGKEKFQFNYGVFLLNKNISQLRFYCGLGTSDLRLTLPNIKSMLELRLGVKFDSLGVIRPLPDTRSVKSNDKDDTVSSIASGGKSSVPDPAEEALEKALINGSHDSKNTNNFKKETSPNSLNELHVPVNSKDKDLSEDEEDLFKPSEDNFFKLKTVAFVDDSCGNSSCGSFSEQTNGMTVSSRNFSLSPSPGSVENQSNGFSPNQSDLSNLNLNDSKTSPQSCDESGDQSCDLMSGKDNSNRREAMLVICDNNEIECAISKNEIGEDVQSSSKLKTENPTLDPGCDNS